MGHINGLHLLGFVAVVAVITVVVIARSPKAPQQDTDQFNPITYYTTYRQRAFMAAFICNVMGYGTNSDYFKRMRSSALIQFRAYGHLVDALANARRVLQIPPGEMSTETREHFMACLVDDKGFILNCARYADFIEKLVDDSYVIMTSWGTPIPDELIIAKDVTDAFRRLRDNMWPTEDFSRQG